MLNRDYLPDGKRLPMVASALYGATKLAENSLHNGKMRDLNKFATVIKEMINEVVELMCYTKECRGVSDDTIDALVELKPEFDNDGNYVHYGQYFEALYDAIHDLILEM